MICRVVSGCNYDQYRTDFIDGYYRGTLNLIPKEKHNIRDRKDRYNLFDKFTCVNGMIGEDEVIVCVDKFGFKTSKSGLFVIGKVKLRDKYNLKDGCEIEVKI